MPEPRKTPEELRDGTAHTQALFSIIAAACFAVSGGLVGYFLAGLFGGSPSLAIAGFFLPLGSLAIFYATRKPPEILPAERPPTDG